MTLRDLWYEGPPVRLTLVAKLTGLSVVTLRKERDEGYLKTFKPRCKGGNSPDMVEREAFRTWALAVGLIPRSAPKCVEVAHSRLSDVDNRG